MPAHPAQRQVGFGVGFLYPPPAPSDAGGNRNAPNRYRISGTWRAATRRRARIARAGRSRPAGLPDHQHPLALLFRHHQVAEDHRNTKMLSTATPADRPGSRSEFQADAVCRPHPRSGRRAHHRAPLKISASRPSPGSPRRFPLETDLMRTAVAHQHQGRPATQRRRGRRTPTTGEVANRFHQAFPKK